MFVRVGNARVLKRVKGHIQVVNRHSGPCTSSTTTILLTIAESFQLFDLKYMFGYVIIHHLQHYNRPQKCLNPLTLYSVQVLVRSNTPGGLVTRLPGFFEEPSRITALPLGFDIYSIEGHIEWLHKMWKSSWLFCFVLFLFLFLFFFFT